MLKIKQDYYFIADEYRASTYDTLNDCRVEAIKYAKSCRDTALGSISIFVIEKVSVVDVKHNAVLTSSISQIDYIFVDYEKRISWTMNDEDFHYIDFYLDEEE